MFYAKDHPFLIPKDTGLPSGDFSRDQMRAFSPELTEAEKKLPHAKYFYKLPAPLPQEHLDAMAAGPIDSADAFEIWDYAENMNNTGHCRVENGYCVLPSGVSYAAACVKQVGRTDEMVEYYNKYFAPEECLFYKNWFPGAHMYHFNDGAIEDFGFGRQLIKFIGGVEVEDLHMNYEDIEKNDPACISINGSQCLFYDLAEKDPEPVPGILIFYHRLTDYGREMRMRFYVGVAMGENREYVIKPVAGPVYKKLIVASCGMCHLMQEYTNDHYLETWFWEDNHQN